MPPPQPPFAPDTAELAHRFAYHPPRDDAARGRHETVRETCLALALDLVSYVPPGRELSLAITHLEEVMFWANAAVAREGYTASLFTG